MPTLRTTGRGDNHVQDLHLDEARGERKTLGYAAAFAILSRVCAVEAKAWAAIMNRRVLTLNETRTPSAMHPRMLRLPRLRFPTSTISGRTADATLRPARRRNSSPGSSRGSAP